MNNQEVTGDGAKTELAPRAQARRVPRQKHGLSKLIRGRSKALTTQLDARCKPMQAMYAYRADLISSLGGADSLSFQEMTIIELVAKDKLLIDTLDAYLLTVGIFSRRKKSAFPLLLQRNQIADSLTRKLQALGLARRSKPVQTLADLLKSSPGARTEVSQPIIRTVAE